MLPEQVSVVRVDGRLPGSNARLYAIRLLSGVSLVGYLIGRRNSSAASSAPVVEIGIAIVVVGFVVAVLVPWIKRSRVTHRQPGVVVDLISYSPVPSLLCRATPHAFRSLGTDTRANVLLSISTEGVVKAFVQARVNPIKIDEAELGDGYRVELLAKGWWLRRVVVSFGDEQEILRVRRVQMRAIGAVCRAPEAEQMTRWASGSA